MTPMLLVVAAGSLAVVAYVYFGYPLLLLYTGRRPRPVARAPIEPSVTLIVPAFDEEATIGDKIRNALALDYPEGRLEVIVASDGSTDRTCEVARREGGDRVRVLDLPRRGKAFALNDAAAAASGEILAFTDAATRLDASSLRRLVENFADDQVGGACAAQGLASAASDGGPARGEGLYWRYDQWLKRLESRTGSVFAADGSLHALRRELYVPMIDPAQADDMAISMRVPLQGRRLVHEPLARAWESRPLEARVDFRRKVRIANHSMAAVLGLGPALWRSGFYSVELVSHKLLRHLVPFFLLALLASTAVLAPLHPLLSAAFAAQIGFYSLAAAGLGLRGHRAGRFRLVSVPAFFCLANAAAFLGVIAFAQGRRIRAWTPGAS